jgi:hypothetical protein
MFVTDDKFSNVRHTIRPICYTFFIDLGVDYCAVPQAILGGTDQVSLKHRYHNHNLWPVFSSIKINTVIFSEF